MELYILDPNLQTVGMIDDAESKLWNKKFDDVGECEIYSPYTDELRDLLKRGNYVYRYDDDMACIITDVVITTGVEEGDYITATARDICTILSGRVVRWSTVFSGKVTDFVKRLLNENVIAPNSATAKRKIDNFTLDETNFPRIPTTIEASAQTEDLLNLIIATCKSAGCGFRVSIDIGRRVFVFALQAGYDRSTGANGYVEFSPEFSNMTETSYTESNGNYKNVVYVGYKLGNDSGLELMSVYRGDTEPSGIGRKEVYIDGTGTSREITLDELRLMYPSCYESNGFVYDSTSSKVAVAQYDAGAEERKYTMTDTAYLRVIKRLGVEAFSDYNESRGFVGSVDAADTYEYKVDYDLGDIVLAKNRFGISAYAKIAEVMESEDNEDGYQIEPRFEYIE